MQTIQQLISELPEYLIIKELVKLYPKEIERVESGYYRNLIERLREVATEPNEEMTTLHVEYEKDFGKSNQNYIWQASYSLNHRYHAKYSLQSLDFERMASALVAEADVKKIGEEAFIAHLLYELMHLDFFEEDFSSIKQAEKEYCHIEEVINMEIESD